MKPEWQPPYRKACAIQDVLKGLIDNKETEPKDVAACARAWDVMEERKRILRGKPLPGALKPKPVKSKTTSTNSIEPIALPPPDQDEPPASALVVA